MTLRNGEDSQEATQETFMDVLRGLRNYDVDGPARFETWLYRVTVNRCKTRLRRKQVPSADWDELEERLERMPVSEGATSDGTYDRPCGRQPTVHDASSRRQGPPVGCGQPVE